MSSASPWVEKIFLVKAAKWTIFFDGITYYLKQDYEIIIYLSLILIYDFV